MESILEGSHGEKVLEAALGVVWWVSIVSARALLGRSRDTWATESEAERPRCELLTILSLGGGKPAEKCTLL